MPKLRVNATIRKWQEADASLWIKVEMLRVCLGMTMEELAKELSMSLRTLYRRKQDPSSFSIKEIRILKDRAERVGINIDEFGERRTA